MVRKKPVIYCSFCGKSQNETNHIIAGPSVYICDECVHACIDILEERKKEAGASNDTSGKPKLLTGEGKGWWPVT